MSAEQQLRDALEAMGFPEAQGLSAGDIMSVCVDGLRHFVPRLNSPEPAPGMSDWQLVPRIMTEMMRSACSFEIDQRDWDEILDEAPNPTEWLKEAEFRFNKALAATLEYSVERTAYSMIGKEKETPDDSRIKSLQAQKVMREHLASVKRRTPEEPPEESKPT